jgi:hypothetical protein
MKDFLIRILLAVVVTVGAFALASSARAQQADEDPAPATPRQPQSAATPQSPHSHDASPLPSGEAQTQDVLTFTGRVAKEQGQLVLNDPVAKMNYRFDDRQKRNGTSGSRLRSPASLT